MKMISNIKHRSISSSIITTFISNNSSSNNINQIAG